MNLVARADRDLSLHAVWEKYLRALSLSSSATVGHAILMARYYDGTRGQFLSQDPTHLAIGKPNELKHLTQQEQRQLLADPQALNSYAYGRGNPIVNKDPTGLCFEPLSAIACAYTAYSIATLAVDAYDAYNTNIKYRDVFSQEEKSRTNFKLGYDFLLTATGAKIARDFGKAAEAGFDTLTAGLDVLDTYFGPQTYRNVNQKNVQTQLQSQTSQQVRQQAVQNYNAATRASSPQSKLWVTPSGAVVDWRGKVISAPPPGAKKK